MKILITLILSIVLLIIGAIIGFNLTKDIKRDYKPPPQITIMQGNTLIAVSPIAMIKGRVYGVLTKYTNRVEETDDTPNIMASGRTVYIGAIACPSNLDFGTTIKIDGKNYTCEDRMAKRYRNKNHFDIFEFDYNEAREFGRQQKEVIIYK